MGGGHVSIYRRKMEDFCQKSALNVEFLVQQVYHVSFYSGQTFTDLGVSFDKQQQHVCFRSGKQK